MCILESKLLELISTSTDLISSEEIVNEIECIKSEIGHLSIEIETISQQMDEYTKIKEGFIEMSQGLMSHFEFLTSLNSTCSLYSFSAHQFLEIVEKSLEADSLENIKHHLFDPFLLHCYQVIEIVSQVN